MEKVKINALIGSLFNPWFFLYNISFVYIGMLLANGLTLTIFILITIAFFSARTAAFIMNKYVGREIDLKNKKKLKQDASLSVPKKVLLSIFIIATVVFMACAYELNTLALLLAPLVLLLFIVDPMLKRHTPSRHFSIGLVESFSALAGYIGVTGAFPIALPLYFLMVGMIFIGSGFDIIYSVVYVDFDRKHGLRTYPVRYGVDGALKISAVLHAAASACLIMFASLVGSYVILIGALASIVTLSMEHIGINKNDDNDLMRRFKYYNSLLAMLLLASVVIFRFVIAV